MSPNYNVIKSLITAAFVCASVTSVTQSALADTNTAIQLGDGYTPQFNGGYFGTLLVVNQTIEVTALGAFSSGGNKWMDSPVYLGAWNGTSTPPTLIASAVVPDGTPSVNSFAFESITPVTLTPGEYVVSALGYSVDDGGDGWADDHENSFTFGNGSGDITKETTLQTAGGDVRWDGSNPSNLASIDTGLPGYSGNFEYVSAPEPSSAALLGAAGLVGMVWIRSRKQA